MSEDGKKKIEKRDRIFKRKQKGGKVRAWKKEWRGLDELPVTRKDSSFS